MKSFTVTGTILAVLLCSVPHIWSPIGAAYAKDQFPEAVKIVAPDGLSTKVYRQPKPTSEIMAIALHGDILEALGREGDYIKVRLPASNASGYVPVKYTIPWVAPQEKGGPPLVPLVTGSVVAALVLIGFLVIRARKAKEAERRAALISASIRDAEDLFRSSDFTSAIEAFKRHLELQGGEVRNPDVYRRLSVCYQKIGEPRQAAKAWEKMRALRGLKNTDDYALGVEIMTSLGQEAKAAEICERLLEVESDEDKLYEIRKNVFGIYRRLKDPGKVLEHAIELLAGGASEPEILSQAAVLLVSEGQTDLAIAANHKDVITRICEEFMEEKSLSPEAERIYLKCLEYDRTDQRLHRLLAERYKYTGDFRKAVSELTILHQLDKENADEYAEEAAKLYVENSRVKEALAAGIPHVIRKIAQIYLTRSEVSPDAVAVYEKILEFQPRAVGVNKMLSTVYLTRGDLDKYIAKLRLLHEIDGQNHDYLADLAQCVIDNDLIDETIKEGNRELNTKILRQLIKREAYDDKAVSIFESLIRHEPANFIIGGALAKAYERRGDFGKALDQLMSLSKFRPDDRELAVKIAKLAVDNDLLEPLLREGEGRALNLAAQELINRKADGPLCQQVLARALEENPQDETVTEYLGTLGIDADQGESQPEPGEPLPAKEPPIVTGLETTEEAVPPVNRKEENRPGPARQTGAPTEETREKEPPQRMEPRPRLRENMPREESSQQPEPNVTENRATEQIVEVTSSPERLSPHMPATTFVSAHAKDRAKVEFREEELFHPATGGLAYKDMQAVSSDGWGMLHLAIEVNTGRKVLLRVFKKDLLEAELMGKFVSQVSQLGFNLVHEHVLDLEDVVTGPDNASGLVYTYLPSTLEQELAREKPPSSEILMAAIGGIVDALAHANNYKGLDGKLRRTFHLHLQPSHILLSEDLSTSKVIGLGYSQIFRNLTMARQPRWQDPGMNPAYMPPEFFRSKAGTTPERVVDVYSLGVMIYLIVTGELPLRGPSFEDYKFQHGRMYPEPPRLMNASVPQWLDTVILTCLEKDPGKRWNSVAELRKALRREVSKARD
ncbi:MAG: protein kinase [Deltaproteobacteria bacterium]